MDYREPENGDFQKLTELLSQMLNAPQTSAPQTQLLAQPDGSLNSPVQPSNSTWPTSSKHTSSKRTSSKRYASSSSKSKPSTPASKVAFNACSALLQGSNRSPNLSQGLRQPLATAYTAAPRGLSPAFGAMHGTSIPKITTNFRPSIPFSGLQGELTLTAPKLTNAFSPANSTKQTHTSKQGNVLRQGNAVKQGKAATARPYVRSKFHSGFANSAVANFPPPVVPTMPQTRAPAATSRAPNNRTSNSRATNNRATNSRARQAPPPPPKSWLTRLLMFPVYLILILLVLILFPFMLLKRPKTQESTR